MREDLVEHDCNLYPTRVGGPTREKLRLNPLCTDWLACYQIPDSYSCHQCSPIRQGLGTNRAARALTKFDRDLPVIIAF